MKPELHRLITESRQLLRVASPEQKMRLLKLIKESLARHASQNKTATTELSKNLDYLEEK